jgi:integrase
MQYTDEGEHPALGGRKLKTSKHGTGSRVFPVPQALLDLGLLGYLAWLKGKREVALFPRLTNMKGKGLYEGWGRWWRRYVRDAKIIAEDKRQLRELRHNFPTAARECGLPSEAIAYLLGHSNSSMTSRYGSLNPLGEHMSEVRFKGLHLASVQPWRAPE